MLIRNARVNNTDQPCSIYISADGEYTISPSEMPAKIIIIDSEDNYTLMPGLLDAHIHGIGGYDFTDAKQESIAGIMQKLGEVGVAYCMATLASLELSQLKKALSEINQYVVTQGKFPQPGVAAIVGIHLEGPFIAKNCKGAHDETVLQPRINMEIFKDIISAAPDITEWKITLAPDVIGAIDFIREAKASQNDKFHIKIFIGHTNADNELLAQAIEAGADGFTHLGNANAEKAQRCCHSLSLSDIKSNVVNEAFNRKSLKAELIIDGEHLSPEFVRFACEQLGNNIILVSDLLNAALMPENEKFMLGSLAVTRQGNKIVLINDVNTLAGSATPLPDMLKVMYSIFNSHKSAQEIIDLVYHAAVVNPRMTSLHSDTHLPDKNNFILVQNKTGEIILHACNGKLFIHNHDLMQTLKKTHSFFDLFLPALSPIKNMEEREALICRF